MEMSLTLRQFIESGGKHVPTDVENYVRGGRKEDYCVFCNKKHEQHTRFNFNKENDKTGHIASHHCRVPRHSDSYACKECASIIQDTVYSDVEKYPIRLEEFKKNNVFLERRIQTYISDRVFVDLTNSYPPVLSFTTGNSDSHKCVFCEDNLLLQHGRITPIEVPIGAENTRTMHGRAYCCEYCDSKLIEETNARVKAGLGTLEGYWDTCVECDNHYPITETEMKARQEMGTEGKHYCCSCIEYSYPDVLTRDRFPTADCTGGCGDQQVFDLSVVLYVPKPCYCRNCLEKTFEMSEKPWGPIQEKDKQAPRNEELFIIKTFYSGNGLEESINLILYENGIDLPYTKPYFNYELFHENHHGSNLLCTSDDFNSSEDALAEAIEKVFNDFSHLFN